MIYLKKSARVDGIIAAAIQIAMEDGITAITARRVAKEAGIAVGQIHHHFHSVGQLKSAMLLTVNRQFVAQWPSECQAETLFEHIYDILEPLNLDTEIKFRRLWNEAAFLAEQDSDIKDAYEICMQEWLDTVVQLIEKGQREAGFRVKSARESAWRLIGLSCGLDSIAMIDSFGLTPEAIKQHIYIALKFELYGGMPDGE